MKKNDFFLKRNTSYIRVKVLDCKIVVSGFDYSNTLKKEINPLILTAMSYHCCSSTMMLLALTADVHMPLSKESSEQNIY